MRRDSKTDEEPEMGVKSERGGTERWHMAWSKTADRRQDETDWQSGDWRRDRTTGKRSNGEHTKAG